VTEQVQKCIGRFPRQRCSSTVKPLRTTDYVVLVLQQGAYGSFQYTTTLFDLADGDTTGFRVATVQGLTTSPFLSGHPAVFDAEGYSASGAKVVETITPGNPSFAIYQDDFFDPELIAGFASEGTTQRSGLRWPRVVGTRNGWPFWYSATLPTIVRDLVHLCNPGPHSFYRLPWTNNVTKNTGQGNSTSGSHGTGSSQEFAFDFGLSDGNSIRATRGGKVEWLTETQTANFNPNQPVSPSNQPFPQGSLQNWGNAVRIAHQDGTFAWYFHIKTNRVFVNVGETVVRGQVIAEADNTGRSTDAHLHYQVQDNNANWGQSIQIRFDTASHGSCYIPVTGDDVTSNNTFGS
jgi:murein DD-endopeptidase MepM/ murein hydrolase activator NlpD